MDWANDKHDLYIQFADEDHQFSILDSPSKLINRKIRF